MGLLHKKWMEKPLNTKLLAVIANLNYILMELSFLPVGLQMKNKLKK